ncbi:MAG: hypothetical protein ABIG73_00500 [Patescibacteria group bacterium]
MGRPKTNRPVTLADKTKSESITIPIKISDELPKKFLPLFINDTSRKIYAKTPKELIML